MDMKSIIDMKHIYERNVAAKMPIQLIENTGKSANNHRRWKSGLRSGHKRRLICEKGVDASRGYELSIYQFIRHLQSFGSGRHSRRSLMARRRARVNQESRPRASLAGWRSGCFFRQGLDCWLDPTCRSRPPNRGREP